MKENSYLQCQNYYKVFRYGFTMIELIFAIVIIGITMLGVPLLIRTDSQSQERNLLQEAIMITTTKISQILTYPWDPQSNQIGLGLSSSQVLGTAIVLPATGLERSPGLDFRAGHFQLALRRRMTPVNNARNATAVNAAVAGALTNLNDFDNTNVNILGASGALAYKSPYRLRTTVNYITDALNVNTYNTAGVTNLAFDYNMTDPGITTNIKVVRVLTQQQNINTLVWTPVVELVSFSCNIGETSFYKRRY